MNLVQLISHCTCILRKAKEIFNLFGQNLCKVSTALKMNIIHAYLTPSTVSQLSLYKNGLYLLIIIQRSNHHNTNYKDREYIAN